MTKEEALKWLDTIMTQGEQVDALEMAIEALEENEKLKQELKEVKQELATFKALC
jgi:AmiR/NasT family two-component response regulator